MCTSGRLVSALVLILILATACGPSPEQQAATDIPAPIHLKSALDAAVAPRPTPEPTAAP